MKVFDFKKPEMSFNELDSVYQNHFIKEFVLTGILSLGSIILCIFIKRYLYILGCLLITTGYAFYLLYQIYKSLTGKILVLDLCCVDIKRQEKSLLGNKEAGSKTCSMVLKSENDLTFVQSVAFSSSYKTGDIVRIYAEDGSITQMNSNTYSVLNPVFMHVLATK
ncbi:MAG: hypothetical protein HUJ68_05260 [Clostridia bacterium]|nr:hypothetical protein [Clostridia bacterium]